jgi:hypothetical protein
MGQIALMEGVVPLEMTQQILARLFTISENHGRQKNRHLTSPYMAQRERALNEASQFQLTFKVHEKDIEYQKEVDQAHGRLRLRMTELVHKVNSLTESETGLVRMEAAVRDYIEKHIPRTKEKIIEGNREVLEAQKELFAVMDQLSALRSAADLNEVVRLCKSVTGSQDLRPSVMSHIIEPVKGRVEGGEA